MPKTFEKVWTNCLEIIKDIVEWQHYKTWFEPIRPVELKVNVLVIQVPSQFFYEYLEEHYVNLLAKTLRRIWARMPDSISDYGRQRQPAK
jgi:chromosomal replication initiator protein